MYELQQEIEQAKLQIQQAGELLKVAIHRRNNAKKAGISRNASEDAVAAAKDTFTAAEVRLRALYEGKGNWVPLSQVAGLTTAPAPIAVG